MCIIFNILYLRVGPHHSRSAHRNIIYERNVGCILDYETYNLAIEYMFDSNLKVTYICFIVFFNRIYMVETVTVRCMVSFIKFRIITVGILFIYPPPKIFFFYIDRCI